MVIALPLGEGAEPAELVHHWRGARRLRLRLAGLLGSGEAARRIELRLRGWEGVAEVRADPRSGRILIRYRQGAALLSRLERREERRPAAPASRGIGPLRGRRAPGGPASPWWALPVEKVLARLGSTPGGLTALEAAARLRRLGPNAARELPPRSRVALLGDQLANLPALLLLGSSALSLLLGDPFDAAAILTVIALNAGIGYRIERRNRELLASWQRIEEGEARALRDGVMRRIAATELVPGDVLLCAAGDVLAADARVVEAHRLACDEAALTGESDPQVKSPRPRAEGAPLAERSSMLHAGTAVVSGHGRAVVTATGDDTERSLVRRLVEEGTAPRPPLTRRLDRLANRVSLFALGASGVAGVAQLAWGRRASEALRSAVALGVAAIPEGLPLVSTAALVRSMQRMRAAGMVVRRLASAETLGGVTVICADKTGTLTLNRMRLEVLDLGGEPLDPALLRARADLSLDDPATLALAAALLNSDVDVQRSGRTVEVAGSSTEQALVNAAHTAGLDSEALRRLYPRRLLSERREGVHYVVSVHQAPGGGTVAFIKGAPEQVLGLCARDLRGRLDAAARRRALERNEEMAARGLRVLALAWRPAYGRFTFIGFAGLRDPLRPGAAETVEAARSAGIRTVILTGDQRRTAEAIARAVGLHGEALDGGDAVRLAAAGEGARLGRAAVISRVSPADKAAIVRALRQAGEVVAMAGDGINDAPALKAADVGIAVGVRASDLARQVADVVMAEEDLRSILTAVGEGRLVQDNLGRAILYLFATNLSELALVLGAALAGGREPLRPLQLLWINLLTDSLPAMALALEPGSGEVQGGRKPARAGAPLVSGAELRRMARDGLLLGAGGALALLVGGPPLAFSVLVGAQLGYTALCRGAPGVPDARFLAFAGAAMGLQAIALGFAPLRAVLGIGGRALPALAGFVVGLLAPAIVGGVGGDRALVIRTGKAPAVELPGFR